MLNLAARSQQLSSSRSFDPLQSSGSNARSTPERKGSSGTLNAAPRSESPIQREPSHNYLSASQASSHSHTPSPLSLSSVGLAAEVQATPRKSPPLSQSPTEDALPSALTAVPARSDSLSVSSTPTPSPSTTRSARSISPSEPADPVLGTWQPQGTPRSAPPPSQPQVQVLTPATPESAVSTPRAQGLEPSRLLNGSTPNGRSSPPRSSPINSTPSQLQPVTITLNGESHLNARLVGASRDSQISLPEEARRYYATMASPAGSPGSKLTFSSSNPNSPLRQEHVVQDLSAHFGSNGVAEMNGTVSRSVGLGIPDSAEPSARTLSAESRGRPNGHVPGSQRAASVEDGAEFLDMDDEDSAYDIGVSGTSNGSIDGGQYPSYVSYEETEETLAARRRGKTKNARPSGPAVEDFPLPPGTTSVPPPPRPQQRDTSPPASNPPVQVHMGTPSRQGSMSESTTTARESRPSLQSTSASAAYQPSLASSQTLLPDQPPPSPFPLPLPANPPTMSFRALPLLSQDLPYTEIVVANSSIRPNDRGKEVLSFTIAVEPGRGKDGWKVEKLYSDVLNLDARVRAAVGRSASKKLAALPEGRLWRDHAPAKVDQRKVCGHHYRSRLSFRALGFPRVFLATTGVASSSFPARPLFGYPGSCLLLVAIL